MIETDTSITTGSCTELSDKIEAQARQAGFGSSEITRYGVPDHPKEGGIVIILPGTSKTLKPLLLMGHIDVVAAKREDWTRDPYKLIEEDGYFYGRGTTDMKAMDAIWLDAMIRFKEQGYKPKRTIKVAFTCGEETSWAFNGNAWLTKNRPDLVDAAFALNEGGIAHTDASGKLGIATIQVGEKTVENYQLETFNAGGHSSVPVRDNAIYQLSEALLKIRDYEFPIQFNDVTRTYFAKAGAIQGGEVGQAMVAIAKDPQDRAAAAIVDRDRSLHAMLRTTCVATLQEGGHANNALPQHAKATVNCRVLPGSDGAQVLATLTQVIGDSAVKITRDPPKGPTAKQPPLDPAVIAPIVKVMAKYYPGVPVLPSMLTAGTDDIFLEAIGIPCYGVPGIITDADLNHIHGLNEKMSVKALYTGRDLLTDLIKAYAG
ncbi:M20/M25/M40 family metallo-hydrolase [Sphingomonas oligophenolica]